jgi:hypothetical protein
MMQTEERQFPLSDAAGMRMLRWLREHPHAPRYTHPGRDRLNADGLKRVRAFEAELQWSPAGWRHAVPPRWLAEFVAHCYRDVPYYRGYGAPPTRFEDTATCDRADLQREPWAFVPDDLSLDDLVVYQTSGATGHPLDILTHPEPLAMYVPLLQAALATRGVRIEGGAERVSIVCVCFQKQTWTYASILPSLDQAGYAKVNLNPLDWSDPLDPAIFLDACDPEIYTGDPLSFAALAQLPLTTRPKALISTAMTLLPGLRQSLEEHFGCPVIDLYSTNETGPIAAATGEGYVLLQPRLYVEILDAAGAACLPGTRGEITVSGGLNPYLPLLRYRTGDFASLAFHGTRAVLVALEGRAPVVFRAVDGRAINNIDVSTVLKPLALAQYTLHQSADGTLQLRLRGASADIDQAAIRAVLLGLFGASQALRIENIDSFAESGDKLWQYTREETRGN